MEDSDNQLNYSLNRHSCRICLEDDLAENMTHPCKCKGTTKYVHKHCLNEWRTTSTNRANFHRCEMCHYTYDISNNNIVVDSYCTKFLRFISNGFMVFYMMYSMLIFIIGNISLSIDTDLILYKYFIGNITEDTSFIQPFYYLFSGFCIFLLQLLLIAKWFIGATNRRLYCKLYNSNKLLILNSVGVMIISGFLFGWLLAILFLELISLRLFQIHFSSIDQLYTVNTSDIDNYIEPFDNIIDIPIVEGGYSVPETVELNINDEVNLIDTVENKDIENSYTEMKYIDTNDI